MGIRNFCNICRFFTIHHFFKNTLFQSPTGSSPICTLKPFLTTCSIYNPRNIYLKLDFQFHTPRYFCSNPNSSYKRKPYTTSKQVSEIIALICDGVNDLEYRLNMMNVSLSLSSVVYVFDKLASERVSALMFFHWLNVSHRELCCDPEIGNLVIENCGLLGNYEAMVPVLVEFNLKRMCLGRRAFRFLVVLRLDKDSSMECVRRVVDALNKVGGVCRSSGVKLLIETFSFSGDFDIAEYVIEETGRNVSRYNFLLRLMCKRGYYERVDDLVEKMKGIGVEPDGSTYNLLVSCLMKIGKFVEACQVFEMVERENGLPDGFSVDVLISLLCKHGQIDLALKFLDKMALKGIQPCSLTNAVVIKSYFESGKYDEAHEYVVDSACKHSYSSNESYTLLASLYLKKGSVLLSQRILREMMDRGLKPNYSVYMKIRKCLEKKNKKDLSLELSTRFSSFIEK
ncbi:pentatricopeptide repeat-containing protein At5g02860 [Lathyrus oleraceus]|nr:pentatricopeptide repeat-containing protein At5g02860-like [Pisum sativum]